MGAEKIVRLQQRIDADIHTRSEPLERPECFEARTPDEVSGSTTQQVVQSLLGDLTVIAAPPNGGKSAFAVDMLMCVAAGIPFFGRKVRQSPVLYVAPEAPYSIVQRSKATLREKFHSRRQPFYIVRDNPRLGHELFGLSGLERLQATLRQVESDEGSQVRVMVLDTVAMVLAGSDENGDGMLRLVDMVQEMTRTTGTSVVMLHHPSKADPEGLRGHSSLSGAADVIIQIAHDPLANVRTATVSKNRNGPTGGEIHFALEAVTQPELDDFGDPVSTVIVRAAEQSPAKAIKANGANQQKALTALREWSRTHTDEPFISSADVADLLMGQGINRHRKVEVIKFLTMTGLLIASVGGYTVQREVLI